MRKKFITNLLLLLILNLLVKPFWMFGIDRTVQNTVGADEYGLYISLFNFSLLLNFLLDLGITNFNNRKIAQNKHLLEHYLSNIVVLKMIISLVYAFITLGIALLIDYDERRMNMLYLLVLNQFLLSFILYLRSNISGLHLFRTDSFLSVLDRLLMILICSVLLWTELFAGEFRIEWFVYAQTLAYGLTAVVALFLVLQQTQKLQVRLDWQLLTKILKQTYPFAILTLLMTVYNRIDAVMLERLLEDGERQAGIYAQAFRILDAASMFALLFAGLLLPIFSRMIQERSSIDQLLWLSFFVLLVPAFIVGIGSVAYSSEIIDLLYHDHVSYSARLFSILILGFIPISSSYIFGTLLTANGNLKALNYMALGGVFVNVSINLALIPILKSEGAAWASLITQSLTAIAQIIIGFLVFKLKLPLKRVASFIGFLALSLLWAYASHEMPFHWILNLIVYTLGSFLFAFLFGIFSIKKAIAILKEKHN